MPNDTTPPATPEPPFLGLDIGLKRTGVALSEAGLIAEPLTTISWTPPHTHSLIDALLELIARHEIVTVVAGLPLYEDGGITEQSEKTAAILTKLQESLPSGTFLITVNEYSSTHDAQVRFPGVDIDSAAATVILQNYLDERAATWS
jgi:putative transcription antitermination factor YqgF